MQAITEFQGNYRWLSNFWPCPVELAGVIYPSVEHAYQAAKTLSPAQRVAFERGTAGEAKRRGRKLKIRAGWDDMKVDVMRALIQQKFARGTLAAGWLAATGSAQIIEGNTWGDTFWGVCRGVGENHLGKLIMEQRAALQEGP